MLDKLKASGLHLLISTLVIGSFLLPVYLVWYPYPLYVVEGLSHVVLILLGVNLILGPLLTLILYRKEKKYLLLDLSVVVAFQISAFAYGAITISSARPVYIVFAVDQFKTVTSSMVDISTLKNKSLKYSFFSSPIYVYAALPDDLKELEELMWSSISGGKDIEQLPKYYRNYPAHISQVKEKSLIYKQQHKKRLALLLKSGQYNDLPEDTFILPFFTKNKEVAAIAASNGKIIDYINVRL